MSIDAVTYKNYIAILQEELIPAVGCTEPACLALAGAKLREVLGELPERLVVKMSGNLIKNTKAVTIPHSNGLKGIPAAVWLGVLGGDAGRGLAVLSSVNTADIEETKKRLGDSDRCLVELMETPAKLHV